MILSSIMKKVIAAVFSMKFAGILLMLFAVVVAFATFIENDLGTSAAKDIVYNALWFEVLLLITAISLVGSVFQYRLWRRKKFSVLFFHLAFVVILAGAFVTRHFGYEGIMQIREGKSSNEIITISPYVQVWIEDSDQHLYYDEEYSFSPYMRNRFSANIPVGDSKLKIRYKKIVSNAVLFEVEYEGTEREVAVFGASGMISEPSEVIINDTKISIGYGSKTMEIPFSLHLLDFSHKVSV